MASLLDRTGNLLALYEHHVGESEVPREFTVWSCLSLIAACVADRVWYEKFHGKRLAPNLYVMLIGPSGLGKGEAIDTAIRYAADIPKVNLYRGKATAQFLLDHLGKEVRRQDGRRILADAKCWLVTPELAMSVGSGDVARDFVTHMTELYSGSEYPMRAGTRTRGEVTLRGHCINWLAGTTTEWLVDSVPASAIAGGFFGRIVPVQAQYDFDKRVWRPKAPPDAKQISEHLRARIQMLIRAKGQFRMTEQAERLSENWYMTRQAPTDAAVIPSWKREDDLVLKLSMLFSLCDDVDLVITEQHVTYAQRLSRTLHGALPVLMRHAATQNPEGRAYTFVSDRIHEAKRIAHTVLLRQFAAKGLGGADAMRVALDTLRQEKRVVLLQGPSGMFYEWIARRMLAEQNGHLPQ